MLRKFDVIIRPPKLELTKKTKTKSHEQICLLKKSIRENPGNEVAVELLSFPIV